MSSSGKKLNRREFIATTAGAAAGLYGLSMLGGSPAHGAKKADLTMLSWNHFVPKSDEKLREHFAAFSKARGIEARLDTIAHLQMAAKKAAEAQARGGHDIWYLSGGEVSLYKDFLVNVDDLAEELGSKYGGYFDLGKEISIVDNHWKGIPWYFVSFPLVVRTDLLEDIGEKVPDTWEDVLRVGTKLKKKGHPVGIQLGHSADANAILHGIMWSYGASWVAADSKTITINSPEMLEAVEFVKELYEKALDPQVMAWDDASNNRCITSGKCSIILNPISAYRAAVRNKTKTKKLDGTQILVADYLDHFIPPKGPGGRHMYCYPLGIGIMSWAKDKGLAKDLIRFHFQKENFNDFIQASLGYNQPLLKAFADHPVWGSNPKYSFAPKIGQYSHSQGWPGLPTKESQVVGQLYIIPDMFAFAATGKKTPKEAIAWAENEIRDIFAGKKEVIKKKK
jgi:multiple sugar transport system substrate-binding protein